MPCPDPLSLPWRIQLLGGLAAHSSSRTVTRFRTRKTAGLLAYLATHPGPRPREILIDLLWPDSDLDAGRHSFSMALSSLRHALEPPGTPFGAVLVADRFALGLNPLAAVTDVADFEAELASAGRATDRAERLERLCAALDLYAGPFLPGNYDEWVLVEQRRLSTLHEEALQEAIRLLKARSDAPRALRYAWKAVEADPLNEEAHRELIGLLSEAGHASEALRQYRVLEGLLRRELEEEPSPETRVLAARIRAGDLSPAAGPASEPGEPSPPRDSPSRKRFPRPLSRFFGREGEIDRLREWLPDRTVRLITLTGPGGSGKTRLSLEVAARLPETFDGSVGFVPLADLTDPGLLHDRILRVLEETRPPDRSPLEQIAGALSRGRSLLVLDNLEQLVEGAAPLVGELLDAVPGLTCLVTSRRRLDLTGEREFPVRPLPIPPAGLSLDELAAHPSVALFVDRARAARPDFALTEGNAGEARVLCEWLEGLPLAIELAASRAQVLTVGEMAAGLSRRFEWLVGWNRDVPERHRSLRATMEWSFELLTPEVRGFLRKLSVFRGGWTLEAAEAVCEEPLALDHLAQLRECSLVEEEAAPEGMRFGMLETVREFAGKGLSEEKREALGQRHAGYYAGLIERSETEFRGAEQARWLQRLDREAGNLKAAMDWCEGSREGTEPAYRILASFLHYWSIRRLLKPYLDWNEIWLARDRSGVPSATVAKLLFNHGLALRFERRLDEAENRQREAADLARSTGDSPRLSFCLLELGAIGWRRGEGETAERFFREAQTLARRVKEEGCAGLAGMFLGHLALGRGEAAEAIRLYQEAIRRFQAVDHPRWEMGALHGLATARRERGEYREAASLFERIIAHYLEIKEAEGAAVETILLAEVASLMGDPDAARRLYREALAIVEGTEYVGSEEPLGLLSIGLAKRAFSRSDFRTGAHLMGSAARLLGIEGALTGSPDAFSNMLPFRAAQFRGLLSGLRSALDDAAFLAAWEAGQAMTVEEATTLAREEADRTDPATEHLSLPPAGVSLDGMIWRRIEPILLRHDPPRETGRSRVDRKAVLEAILYKRRTGCSWSRLPSSFPPSKTVHHVYARWRASGLLDLLLEELGEELPEELPEELREELREAGVQTDRPTIAG